MKKIVLSEMKKRENENEKTNTIPHLISGLHSLFCLKEKLLFLTPPPPIFPYHYKRLCSVIN